MMHKAWSRIEEVPYCFSRSYVKLQGHRALKIVDFDPNWLFPDCSSSLNSPMATKWCKKREVAWKRCPIVFQGHTSNCKVTRAKNRRFESNLSKFIRPVAAIKSLRFALLILKNKFSFLTVLFYKDTIHYPKWCHTLAVSYMGSI